MANRPSTPVIILIVMVVAAGILAVTKYKLPGHKIDINALVSNSNTNSVTNTSDAFANTNSTQATNTNTSSTTNTNTAVTTYTFPGKLPADQIHNKQARIVTNKGTIVFTLDDAQSPLAVSNFVYLAKQGYYDGIIWHRVIAGFVIQGGDPNTRQPDQTKWGMGGPGYQFPDETVTGEYTEGTVAMANAGPDTNGSQFFICNADDTAKLTKNYSIFGHVTQGLDVVKTIAQGDVMQKVTIEPAS